MQRTALVTAAFALLVGCDTVSSPVESGLSAIRNVRASAAETQTINDVTPIDLIVFVPCANNGAGELIEVSGPLHVLIHLTFSNSGNLTIKTHFQPQGVSGVGLTTGDKYQATGVTQGMSHDNNATFINNFRMIGQGPDNNFMVHENFHITVNANGDVTSFHDNFSVTCQ